jgi:tetratricopeptide (TPR) repeat protein
MKAALALALAAMLTASPSLAAPPASAGKRGGGPSITSQARQRASRLDPRATERSLKASIENQKQILDLEDKASASYPKQAVALADFYWDLAEFYGNAAYSEAIEKPLYEAEQRKDATAIEKWKREQTKLLDNQLTYQTKTIIGYRGVVKDFPRAESLAEIRYFLAYNLMQMQRGDEAVEVYMEILAKHPDSPYVPDALVNIGDYYFENNDFESAQKLYERAQAPEFEASNIYGYSVYKQAWCLYNLTRYEDALRRFQDVIGIADARAAGGQKSAIPLKREAQNELVLPYAKIGKPEKAIAFFKGVAPERYLDIASRLADIYTEQSEYVRSNKLLQMLIEEAKTAVISGPVGPDGTRSGGETRAWMGVRFQRQVVSNAFALGDKGVTVEEVGRLITLWETFAPAAPTDWQEEETREVKTKILEVASAFQAEFGKTKDKKTLEHTQRLYDDYLRAFRRDDNAYQISWNNAVLMLQTDKFTEAAAEFEKVIAMNPTGEFADAAAERAVLAYLKTVQIANDAVKREVEEDLTPQPLSADETRFIGAIDRWMELVAKNGPTPETAENIPKARFAAAKVLYNNNHFADAAGRFVAFLDQHAGHPLEPEARRHALSAYNLNRDVDNLRVLAKRFDGLPNLDPDLRADIDTIKREFDFQECFKLQTAHEHLQAAQCFEAYATQHPTAEKAASAIYNASINYFDAKQVERALKTQLDLYQRHGKTELGPKALFAIGEMYRQTTVYDEASTWYEAFVKNHPTHPLAEKALRYASIYRKTLGQNRQAIQNLDLWLKKYRTEDAAPRVDFDIIQITEKMGDFLKVTVLCDKHLKAFPAEAPGLRLQVLNRKGLALLQLRKTKEARQVFSETVAAFAKLNERDVQALDLTAIAAVAESHFQLGEVELQRARAIKFEAASDKAIKAALEEKLTILTKVKETYEKVIAYNHPGWVIAASAQLGFAYEDLADAVENSPDPVSIRHLDEVLSAYRQEMTDQATAMRQKALENYRLALETARRFRWFNDYSEKAERAVARLDLTDLSVKEYRLRPSQLTPNTDLPRVLGAK